MQALKKLFAAALTLSLPLSALAQAAAAPAAAAPAEAPKPAAEAPKPAITPYGFVLLNSFWDGGTFNAKDYPGQASAVQNQGGAFLMSARQSRFGVKLAMNDTNWTGAALTGVIEFDFKAGHTGTTSAGWNAGLMRLRLASATATWKLPYGSFAVLAGQDYGLVNPLFATSVAWVADPIFWQAGNYWRRTPQIRATWAGNFDALSAGIQAAMLSPADGEAGAPDYGAGNRSRFPDLEARAYVGFKASADINGTVGVGFHSNKRRYSKDSATYTTTSANGTTDVTASLVGVDADINVPYVNLKGEWFDGKGIDDTYNGIIANAVRNAAAAGAPDWQTVDSSGYWVQAIIKPIPELWVTAGMGSTELKNLPDASVGDPVAASQRKKNQQVEGGLILNAGKYWKVGLEYCETTTTYNTTTNNEKKAHQVALSSQLTF